MARYYVNEIAQSNGDHEVHREGCKFMPDQEHRIYLGDYDSCRPAVQKAREYFSQVNGCAHCCAECHTQ
ncbi:MAG: hypothetical protein ACFBZ8_12500 [Opitutales bacterium]